MLVHILCSILLQDSAAELVQKLGDEDFNVREEAENKIARMGDKALPDLKKAAESGDVEVRERAARLAARIEREIAVSRVYTPPAPVTLSRTLAVKEALALAGGDMETSTLRDVLDREIALDLKGATPFEVIDEVCRQTKSFSYQVEAGKVRFSKEEFAECPSASEEAFRVRISSVEKYTSTDFRKKQVAWSVTLTAEAWPSCKTFGTPGVTVAAVTDGVGRRIRETDEIFVMGGGDNPQIRQWAAAMKNKQMWGGMVPAASAQRVFTFISNQDSDMLQSIRTVATYFFRVDPREHRIENAGQHQELDLGDFRLHLDRAQKYGENNVVIGGGGRAKGGQEVLALSLEPRKDGEAWLSSVAGDLLEKDSVVAVDAQGNETPVEARHCPTNMQQRIMVNGQYQMRFAATYSLELGKLKPEEVRQIRVRIAGVHRKEVPLEIRDVKLQ
jgi:hypothetical protein